MISLTEIKNRGKKKESIKTRIETYQVFQLFHTHDYRKKKESIKTRIETLKLLVWLLLF